MGAFWSVLGGVGVPLGGVLIGWLTWKQSKKRDSRAGEHELIDQYQEDLASVKADVAQHAKVINAQADYIGALRAHIAAGKPPPPPPYPEGLRV